LKKKKKKAHTRPSFTHHTHTLPTHTLGMHVSCLCLLCIYLLSVVCLSLCLHVTPAPACITMPFHHTCPGTSHLPSSFMPLITHGQAGKPGGRQAAAAGAGVHAAAASLWRGGRQAKSSTCTPNHPHYTHTPSCPHTHFATHSDMLASWAWALALAAGFNTHCHTHTLMHTRGTHACPHTCPTPPTPHHTRAATPPHLPDTRLVHYAACTTPVLPRTWAPGERAAVCPFISAAGIFVFQRNNSFLLMLSAMPAFYYL